LSVTACHADPVGQQASGSAGTALSQPLTVTLAPASPAVRPTARAFYSPLRRHALQRHNHWDQRDCRNQLFRSCIGHFDAAFIQGPVTVTAQDQFALAELRSLLSKLPSNPAAAYPSSISVIQQCRRRSIAGCLEGTTNTQSLPFARGLHEKTIRWSRPRLCAGASVKQLALALAAGLALSALSAAQDFRANAGWPGPGQLFVGTCYQPIDRTPEQIDQDIAIMKRAGSMSCAWGSVLDSFEPAQGDFSFVWFGKIMDKMYANGIRVILDIPGTPAPIWLHRNTRSRYRHSERHAPSARRTLYGRHKRSQLRA